MTGPAAGYETDPHARSLAVCAVVGGFLALLTFVVYLSMPDLSWTAPASQETGNYERISAGVMAVFQSALLLVLCRAVGRRRRASPDAPVTRALVLLTAVLAVLAAAHVLVQFLQVAQPSYQVSEAVVSSRLCVHGGLMWACLILLAGRLRRLRVADSGRLRRWDRNVQVALAAVCALPLVVLTVQAVRAQVDAHGAALPHAALLALPSTALALWGVHRMQRFRRMPVRLLLAGFGWGAVVAPGFTGAMLHLYQSLTANLMDIGKPLLMLDSVVQAPVLEEIAKGTGILLLALVGRRWCTDLVGGVVLGAAVGLGFNFLETVLYMSDTAKDGASFQYWLRQVVTIMTSHVAFSALVGAGIGAAWQSRDRRVRLAVIGWGLLTAISGHYTYNSLAQLVPSLVHVPEPVFAMVVMPLTVLLLQGPFLVMYVLLLRRGLRHQSAALAVELRAEAYSGQGAVTPAELPVLLDPARRFRARVDAWRGGGFLACRRLSLLYQAQLDLGLRRWHLARRDPGADLADPADARRRIRQLTAPHAGRSLPDPEPDAVVHG